MRRAWLIVLAVWVPLASASIVLVHDTSQGSFDPVEPEVVYGSKPATETVGANASNGTATVQGSLTETSTDVFYLNNTNATEDRHVRLGLVGASGSLDLLELGVDNGTQAAQISIELDTVTSDSGSWVRLPPASSGTIYLTHSLGSLTGEPEVVFWTYATDDPSTSTHVKTRAKVTIAT